MAGAKVLTGTYSGDGNFNGSADTESHQVDKADTSTSLSSSANPSKFGQSVTFTATVTVTSPGAGTPSATVTFMDGSTTLVTLTHADSAAPCSASVATGLYDLPLASAAAHHLPATTCADGNYFSATSSAESHHVNKADTSTSLSSSVNPSVFGQSVTFTATV